MYFFGLCFLIYFSTIYISAYASEGIYTCVIKEVKELSKKGNLVNTNTIYKTLIGKHFTINRDNGAIIDLPNLPFSMTGEDATVLQGGSSEFAYKAFSISYETFLNYIYVKEFEEGTNKPFWGSDGGTYIFSGICL